MCILIIIRSIAYEGRLDSSLLPTQYSVIDVHSHSHKLKMTQTEIKTMIIFGIRRKYLRQFSVPLHHQCQYAIGFDFIWHCVSHILSSSRLTAHPALLTSFDLFCVDLYLRLSSHPSCRPLLRIHAVPDTEKVDERPDPGNEEDSIHIQTKVKTNSLTSALLVSWIWPPMNISSRM